MINGRELGDVLKNISTLHGVKPEMEVLREMAGEKGYGSLFLNPEIHERTVDKLYTFYEKEFN